MKSTICICCGEPTAAHGGYSPENPNLCFSCGSFLEWDSDTQLLERGQAPESVAPASEYQANQIADSRPDRR